MRETSHTTGTADFFIHFTFAPADLVKDWHPHPRLISRHPADQGDYPALRILESGQYTRLIYAEGVQFTINAAANAVWVSYADAVPLEYVTMYLTNAVIALCLRLRDQVCLHASAVAVGKHALMMVGGAGAGKSTTASVFAQRQYPVFCDDMCALRETSAGVEVLPGTPRLRLMTSGAEMLFGDLPAIAQNWNKHYVDLDAQGLHFAEQPLPIGAIYVLLPRADAASIQPLPSTHALVALMNNTYLDYLLDQKMRATDMRVLAQLVSRVPVRLITPSDKFSDLSTLVDHLLEDFHTACMVQSPPS